MKPLLTLIAALCLAWQSPPPPEAAATIAAQAAAVVDTPPASAAERLRSTLGPVTMRVSPGRIERLGSDGKVAQTITTNWYNQPLTNALAYALRLSGPGEVIELSGEHPLVRAGGINDSKGFEATRPRDPLTGKRPPIPECAIVAKTDDDIPDAIYGFSVAGTADDTDGGIEGLTFCGIDFVCDSAAPRFAKTAFIVEQFIATGYVRFWGCDFTRSTDPTAWQGWGRMWAARLHGICTYFEAIESKYGDALEWALVYADNLGRKGHTSRIIGCTVTGRGGGRGCGQFANRPDSAQGDPARYGGGRILIEDCDLRCIGGNGGGAITVASSSAHVVIRRCRIELEGPHNGIMVWLDSGHGGLILNDAGFAHDAVVIDSVQIRGGNRPHVAVSAAERVTIRNGFRISAGANDGARHCFDFGADGNPKIPNGEIRFAGFPAGTLSTYAGFQSGTKVRVGGAALSVLALDALKVVEGPVVK
jgi:hypothetical protein